MVVCERKVSYRVSVIEFSKKQTLRQKEQEVFLGVNIRKGVKKTESGRGRNCSLVTEITEALPNCTGSSGTKMALQIVSTRHIGAGLGLYSPGLNQS